MFKYMIISFFVFILASCSQQSCKEDIYNGWINALMCDYDQQLEKKKVILKELQRIENKSLKKENILREEKEKQEEERGILMRDIVNLRSSSNEIEKSLREMSNRKDIKKLLYEVQEEINH